MREPTTTAARGAVSGYQQLEAETTQALTLLRQRLRAILDRLLPDGYGARSLGRALDVEQTTAWRCWRIAHVADPAQALRAMPGRRGWKALFRQFERRGIPKDELEALQGAFACIEPLVYGRRADRTALRSMAAGGLDPTSDLDALRDIRRAISRGNARLYGVQARAVAVAWLVAPGRVRGTVSLGTAGVIDGLRKLRPGPPWPALLRSAMAGTPGKGLKYYAPLGDDSAIPFLIRTHSTRDAASGELASGLRHGHESVELGDLATERNGHVRACHAEWIPAAARFKPGEMMPASLVSPVLLPTETFVFDLWFHRDVLRHTEPTASLYGTPVTAQRLASLEDATRMPLEASMRPVGASRLPKRLETIAAAHGEAVRRVAAAQRARPSDYGLFRLVLPHPPLFATVAGQFELAGIRPPA